MFNPVLLAALVAFLPFNAMAGGPLRLALKAFHTADSMFLKIQDVAGEGTSAEILDRYGKVVLPGGGADGSLGTSDVLMALEKAGADLSGVEIVTPAERRTRPSPEIESVYLIRQEMTRMAAEKFKVPPGDITVELTAVPERLPPSNKVARLTVETVDEGWVATFYQEDGRVITSVPLKGTVSVQSLVVVARHSLMPGEFVTQEDFREEKRPVETLPGAYRKLTEIGKGRWQMTQGLEEGAALKKEDIQQAISFQKGGVVSLVMTSPQFQVRTVGRVKDILEDGAAVLVENLDSKKEVMGRPLSANEVEVVY